ncbi:dCTP deaminase [Pseudoalteromonas sp. GCY]|uniref:dCTP deaminase n=1 Tax=Pseudoalteromonas sp. GCY TaxID=2003316 RepID=UPI000BFF0B05|nr:dCTP deaminase [Pseudoalteromonas sp. GCY]PHI35183.1 dCTP deaminase [Pseudoalteromonas sp. GCY]QQQ68901.1 dCTP deaminase [Pseudoalteromonas sp. GCY]
MYLADNEIRSKLDEINFESESRAQEFCADEQIQPASVDLRLSNSFWIPKKGGSIDLRKTALMELEPRRFWRKVALKSSDCITIKPNSLVLGRVAEKFSIPPDCAGKIEGRSSFARMGLTIHCSADFINPGYRGHMPIQLYNISPYPIKIFPGIPICQLKFIKLTSIPSRLYGEQELQSKYMDDDGGPSYWWRDKRIKKLQKAFTEYSVDLKTQEELLERIGIQEPEIIERFEVYVSTNPQLASEGVDLLLQGFTKKEDKLRIRDKLIKGISYSLFPILASVFLGAWVAGIVGASIYLLSVSTLASVYPFWQVIKELPKTYFGKIELNEAERR